MPDYLQANLTSLAERSPTAAHAVIACATDGDVGIRMATSGVPILECGGRALDSRRDPAGAAARSAASLRTAPVVAFGLGTGYLAEALLARGAEVRAIVVPDAVSLRAAMRARDLTHLWKRTPVFLLEELLDRVTLAHVRALADAVVVHGPSGALSPELAALAERWPKLRPARRPRVLVVGPIYGGSLGIARFVSRAVADAGAEMAFFDASAWSDAHRAFSELPTNTKIRESIRGKLVLLLGEAVVEVARAFGPDLVLAVAQAPLSEPALTTLRQAEIRTAFWFVENWRVIPYWRDVARLYDVFFAIQPGRFLEDLGAAGASKPLYLPLACDAQVHRHVALTADERARFEADVSFAGAPYLNRKHVMAALTDLNLKIWGEGWQGTPLAPFAAGEGRAFDLDEMLRIFAATRVNLNLHSAEHTTAFDTAPDYVNPRTFELASCGAFQLVDRREPLPALFAEDEVMTFGSVAELRTLIAHYLQHPGARAEIAARASTRARRDHTYVQRVRQIFSETLAPELVAGARHDTAPASLEQALQAYAHEPELTREETLLRIVEDVRATSSVL
jgi:spore maturation protein CgeB